MKKYITLMLQGKKNSKIIQGNGSEQIHHEEELLKKFM